MICPIKKLSNRYFERSLFTLRNLAPFNYCLLPTHQAKKLSGLVSGVALMTGADLCQFHLELDPNQSGMCSAA